MVKPTCDVRVVDWELLGHEVPFITNTVKALGHAGLSVEVMLPERVMASQGINDIHKLIELSTSAKLTFFSTKSRKRISYSPRLDRIRSFLDSLSENICIKRQSYLKPHYGTFFTTVHEYRHPYFGLTQSVLGNRWAGHLLHPWISGELITDNYIQTFRNVKLCRGLGLTDERLVQPNRNRYPGLPFFRMPEFVNLNHAPSLSLDGGTQDNRRRVRVTIIGSLSRYKNLLTFLRLSQNLQSIDFYVVGDLHKSKDQYSSDEYLQIEICRQLPNVTFVDGYQPDGPLFNQYILDSSVIWLAYDNFEHSSNVQIKANAFNVPCIVASRGIIYHRRKPIDCVYESEEQICDWLRLSLDTQGLRYSSDYSDYSGYMQRMLISELRSTGFLSG